MPFTKEEVRYAWDNMNDEELSCLIKFMNTNKMDMLHIEEIGEQSVLYELKSNSSNMIDNINKLEFITENINNIEKIIVLLKSNSESVIINNYNGKFIEYLYENDKSIPFDQISYSNALILGYKFQVIVKFKGYIEQDFKIKYFYTEPLIHPDGNISCIASSRNFIFSTKMPLKRGINIINAKVDAYVMIFQFDKKINNMYIKNDGNIFHPQIDIVNKYNLYTAGNIDNFFLGMMMEKDIPFYDKEIVIDVPDVPDVPDDCNMYITYCTVKRLNYNENNNSIFIDNYTL